MAGTPTAASYRWLRERGGGVEEAMQSGEVEGETGWDVAFTLCARTRHRGRGRVRASTREGESK